MVEATVLDLPLDDNAVAPSKTSAPTTARVVDRREVNIPVSQTFPPGEFRQYGGRSTEEKRDHRRE